MNGIVRGGVAAWLLGADVGASELLGAAARMPFPLVVVLGIAARASLALPVEPKANWVFRLTERDTIRGDELHAAERVVTRFTTVIPVALTLPIQWLAAGPRALIAAALTAVLGLLWAEALLRDWHRIPFTCSYMPGKHTIAQSSLAAVGVFIVGGAIAGGLELVSLRSATLAPLLTTLVCGMAVAVLRRQRRRRWEHVPLVFDDEMPSDVPRFRLH